MTLKGCMLGSLVISWKLLPAHSVHVTLCVCVYAFSVCEYYAHVDCQDFAVSDCKECATYVPPKLAESTQVTFWSGETAFLVVFDWYFCQMHVHKNRLLIRKKRDVVKKTLKERKACVAVCHRMLGYISTVSGDLPHSTQNVSVYWVISWHSTHPTSTIQYTLSIVDLVVFLLWPL